MSQEQTELVADVLVCRKRPLAMAPRERAPREGGVPRKGGALREGWALPRPHSPSGATLGLGPHLQINSITALARTWATRSWELPKFHLESPHFSC